MPLRGRLCAAGILPLVLLWLLLVHLTAVCVRSSPMMVGADIGVVWCQARAHRRSALLRHCLPLLRQLSSAGWLISATACTILLRKHDTSSDRTHNSLRCMRGRGLSALLRLRSTAAAAAGEQKGQRRRSSRGRNVPGREAGRYHLHRAPSQRRCGQARRRPSLRRRRRTRRLQLRTMRCWQPSAGRRMRL